MTSCPVSCVSWLFFFPSFFMQSFSNRSCISLLCIITVLHCFFYQKALTTFVFSLLLPVARNGLGMTYNVHITFSGVNLYQPSLAIYGHAFHVYLLLIGLSGS